MDRLEWRRYPRVAGHGQAHQWLGFQEKLGLAGNTLQAYGRCLEDYLTFCEREAIEANIANREQIALYVRDLAARPHGRGSRSSAGASKIGLSNATMQQRLTVVRLFYEHLIEEQLRPDNPVGRGRYTPGKGFAGARERGLIPRYRKLPWIPSDAQWRAILDVVRTDTVRNRAMFAFAYDAALRREELCSLQTGDIDPAYRRIRVRAETTKNRQERVLPYSQVTEALYHAYLYQRNQLSRSRGSLFLSESSRNWAQPLSIWTWSKVIEAIARRAGVPEFTTHTLRHLCLTDLARANWDLHEIAQFAGHRSLQTTVLYIHLSGRELADKLAHSLNTIRATRLAEMEGLFG